MQQYKEATLYFSRDSASVAAIIPAMDRLVAPINAVNKRNYHPSIVAAMKLAKKKMNRYYSLTDDSAAYRIAMVLHPGMKLEYFRRQEWLDSWIEEAEKMTHDEYIAKYEAELDTTQNSADSVSLTTWFYMLFSLVPQVSIDGFNNFGNLSVKQSPGKGELDEYLRAPVENVPEPLKWWLNNSHIYPNLSRMALDYLSIPGKSK